MRKNILIVGHGFATQFIDVSNQYTQLFDKEKYEVTVVYLIDQPNEDVRSRHLADQVVFLNLTSRSLRYLKINAIKKILQLHREKNFEIVICHRYKPIYIMLWIAQWYKIPLLIFVMHELNTLKNISRKILLACLWKKNMYLAGVSNAVRDNLYQDAWCIPKEKIITLYNAIDVGSISPAMLSRDAGRTELNLPQDSFIFGTVGRLAPAKDPLTQVLAFAKIKPFCSNAKLVIMGDGELEQTLKEAIDKLQLVNDVLLLGFVPKAFRFIKAFDLFILSSMKEAFGRVLLEAMIAKVPIIATNAHGIPEVIGDTGTLVNPKNFEQLADKMYLYYKMDKALKDHYAERGYQRAIQEFSTDRFKEIFWQLPLLKREACS